MDAQVDRPSAAGSGTIWRNRNLLTLVGGQWVSQIGNTLFTMAVYWTVLARTGSRADLGFVGSILALASVFGLVAGAFVDRWDRRRTMIWVDVGRTVLAFALLALALGSQFFYPAEASMLPAVVSGADLTAATSMNQSSMVMAQLVGASLGGAILGLLGPVILFGFNGVSFGVSVVTLVLLRVTAPPIAPRQATAGVAAAAGALWREIVQGQRTIWASPFLRRALPISCVVNFALAPINFLDVAWVRQVLHLGAFVYGLFGVAILVGMLAGSACASLVATRISLRVALAVGITAAGLCIVALSRLPLAVPDLLFLAGFGLAVGVVNTMVTASLQRAVPDRVRGRVFGTLSAFSNMAMPLGGLLTGIGATILPIGAIFAGAGVLLAASSLLIVGLPSDLTQVDVAEAVGVARA
jgi:MFS transporter, DHA3 family, macrolide efflux protein